MKRSVVHVRSLGVVLAILAGWGALSSGRPQPGIPPTQVTQSSPPPPPQARSAGEHQPLSPFAAAKAERLIRERLPCLGCHELDGDGGRIAPDLTDVGSRRSAAFIESMIRDPQRTVPGTVMPKTPMTEQVLLLLVDYLRSPGGAGPSMSPDPVTENAEIPAMSRGDAATLYARFCASCHGSDGDGAGLNAGALPVQPTDHTDSAHMSTRPDDSLYDTIHAGGYIMNMSNRMPGFGYTLTPGEIRGLVRYLRGLCECNGPGWSRDQRMP